jgi:hypothetical protein
MGGHSQKYKGMEGNINQTGNYRIKAKRLILRI